MPVNTIIETIQDELNLYTQLLSILENHQQQILARDAGAMVETTTSISKLMAEARTLRQTRSEQLQKAGFENTPDSVDEFLQTLTADKQEVQEEWQELMGLVEQCKEQNRKNGHLLKVQHQITEKVLNRMQKLDSNGAYTSAGLKGTSTASTLQVQA